MSAMHLSPIALEIGTRMVRAVQLRAGRTRERLVAWARMPRMSAEWNIAEAERITHALRRQGFVGQEAVLAMPATEAGASLLEFRGRTAGDVDEVTIRSELSRVHRLDPGAFEFCAWKTPGVARAESWMTVCTAHSRSEALIAPLDATNLRVIAVDAGCFALARGLGSGFGPSSLGVIVHLARECARFVAIVHEQVAYERVLTGLGWRRVVENAQSQLGLDEPITTELLRAMGTQDSRRTSVQSGIVRLRPLVEDHMRLVALELRQSLKYLEGGYATLPLAGVVLSGEGSSIGGWSSAIQVATGATARVLGARDLVDVASPMNDDIGAEMTLAIGLARYPKPEEVRA